VRTARFRLDRLTPAKVTLLRTLLALGGRARDAVLVGGTVRDAWLGRPDADIDLAVPADALALGRRLADRLGGAFVTLDADRGAARVVLGSARLDITDFRAPGLEGDLAARDYTVNALAVPVRTLVDAGRALVVDPTGGLADLAARRLRPPHPRVLAEDPVRALRGVRLEATLGFRLAPGAVRAIRAVAPRLARASAERVRDELAAILALPAAAPALRRLDALGLLAVVLPEIEPMRATGQPFPHRFPVLEHSLRAVAAMDRLLARLAALRPFGEELSAHVAEPLGGGITRRQVLKLVALLHDVAKPETARRVGGRVRFFEHDLLGAARVRAIGERLRFPERVTVVAADLVRHHLRPMHLGASGVTSRARYRFFRDLGPNARDLLLLALADAAAVTGASPLAVWRRAALIRDLLAGWREQQAAALAPPLVRGGDVMARYGLRPGPEVGRLLERAREAQALGLVTTRENALAYLDSCGTAP
jgi:putative nucleotidyltransferase with HDIG domain